MRSTTETAAAIEWDILTTDLGRSLMDQVAAVKTIGPGDLERWRSLASPEQVATAIRLVDGRRRGAAKFAIADRMWFDPVALEQSTGETVARHKAERFAGADVVDLCCGIGGDSISLAKVANRVLAVDRDHGMLRRCLWNAEVHGVAANILGVKSRAESFPIPAGAVVHIDPDRRARARKRAKGIGGYAPGLAFLRSLPDRCLGGAIKLGPASDFDEFFGGRGHEVEIVSVRGECKEATVWFGSLATCRTRATMLHSGATWTDLHETAGRPAGGALSAWLLEPDAALARSGLLDGFAAAHGLARPFAGIDLLTGEGPVSSPWLASFEVAAEMPLDWKTIRREARRLGLDIREVKTRGLPDIHPGEVADRLRDEHGTPATLFLLRGTAGRRAILARRGSA